MSAPLLATLHHRLFVALVAAGGIVSALLMYGLARNWDAAQLQHLVENAAEAQTDAIEERLQAIASELPALRSVFELQPGMSQSEFEKLTASTLDQFPMLHGLGWAPRILTEAGDSFPVMRVKLQNIVPVIVRLDLADEPRRHATLLRAAETGVTASSRPVRLEPDGTPGIVMMLPSYRAGQRLQDAEARQTHLQGILIAAIDLESLFEDTVARLFWDQFDFVVREGGPTGDILHVHAPRSPRLPTPLATEIESHPLVERTMLRTGNQSWSISHAPAPAFMAAHASARPLAFLGLGLLLTVLATAHVMLIQRRHRHVEALVEAQTASLRNSEARYRELAEELRRHRDHLADQVRAQTADLVTARDAAERASHAKSEFLAKMSHELRTPMHAILSFACIGLLKADQVAPQILQGYFRSIRVSCERLLGMVNNLLVMARMEAGRMVYDMQPCDLSARLAEILAEMEPLLEEKALHCTVARQADDCQVCGDALQLDQVLRNLLGNAIKFSPAGSHIEVELAAATLSTAPAEQVPALRLVVADHGPGIPESELEVVFDKFIQGSGVSAAGSGLGLAICREIVQAHAGLIHASTRPEGGARFEVLLPRGGSAP